MPKQFNREAAEREANEIAMRFRDSGDVIQDMSRAYQADFSGIRIHTDAAADEKVKRAGRDALASGKDVFFGKGILESGDPAGKGLLAHELAHTMQQKTASGGEGAVRESAPEGAEQGGLLDWFRNKFKKKPKVKYLGGQKSEDPMSKSYMAAMRAGEQEILAQKRANAVNQAGEVQSVAPSDEDQQGLEEQLRLSTERSNQVWDSNKENEELSPILKTSYALQAQGLRSSQSDMAQADKKVRQGVFSGSRDRYRRYMENLDAGGTDFRRMDEGKEEFQVAGKKHQTNDAITGVSSDLLRLFGDHLQTKEGLDYLRTQMDAMGGMSVFKDRGVSPMNYIMTSMMTGEGASMLTGMTTGQYRAEGDNAARRDVMSHSARNLMVPIQMEEMSEEARKAMPASMQTLFQQYMDLQKKLLNMMGGKGETA